MVVSTTKHKRSTNVFLETSLTSSWLRTSWDKFKRETRRNQKLSRNTLLLSGEQEEEAAGDQIRSRHELQERVIAVVNVCICILCTLLRGPSYQVFPSTNGPRAPAAPGTRWNRVNVRRSTTRNHFQRCIPRWLCTRVLFRTAPRFLSPLWRFRFWDVIVVHEKVTTWKRALWTRFWNIQANKEQNKV